MHVEARQRVRRHEGGYAMVALLVAMSVMGIMMSVALPAWTTAVRREKEAELIFRGEQYARAIALFQRKNGNAVPPSVDVLINQKFLRKRYKDPITGGDFVLLTPGMPIPGQATPPAGGRGRGGATGRGGQPDPREAERAAAEAKRGLDTIARQTRGLPGSSSQQGALIGVMSRSTDTSLRLYNGRDKYNEWVFMGTQQNDRAGGVPGGATPGGPGGAAVPGPGRGSPRGGNSPGRLTLPGGRGAGGDGGGISFPEAGVRRGGGGRGQ